MTKPEVGSEEWEEFEEFHNSDMGTVSQLTEYDKPLTGKKRRMRRPIGFMANIDKLEPCDD